MKRVRDLEIVAVKSSINRPGFQSGDRISSVRRRVSDKCDLRRVKKNTNTVSTACTFPHLVCREYINCSLPAILNTSNISDSVAMTFNKTSKPGFSLPFDSWYAVDLLGQIFISCNFQHAVQTLQKRQLLG